MKRTTDWQPLSAMSQQPGVSWQLSEEFAEYVPTDDIVLDVDGLRRLAFIAGFDRQVTVTATSRAQQQTVDNSESIAPPISGINVDGTATASMALTRSPQNTLGDFDFGRADSTADRLSTMYTRLPLTIGVDVGTCTQTLEKQRQLREPAAWASVLDTIIRSQIRTASRQHLLTDQLPGLAGTELLFGGGALFAHAEAQANTLLAWAGAHTLLAVTGVAGIIRYRNNEQIHTSFMQPQIDRYAVTSVLSHLPMAKIIKVG